jgi:acyl-CoA hydrolase
VSPDDFDAATRFEATAEPVRYRGQLSAAWLQGRTAFGGWAVGAATRIARGDRPEPVTVVSAQLLEPLEVGAVEARRGPLRVGRSVVSGSAELWQGERCCARVQVSLGVARPSDLAHTPPAGPRDATAPRQPLLPIPGVTPQFLSKFQLERVEGSLPYRGEASGHLGGWARHATPASGPEALLALIDAWPPPVLGLMRAPAPSSTVTWTSHLFQPGPPASGWVRWRAQVLRCQDGSATISYELWDDQGALAGIATQWVVVYDRRP